MQTSQEQTNLYKALIDARSDIKTVPKDKQGYGYKYATLDSITQMLDSVLPKHGLGYTQWLTMLNNKRALLTRIYHVSGEWMEDTIEMTDTELSGKANDTQRAGASVTYFRRYTLASIFGIAADEDVDGNIGSQASQVRPKQAPKQTSTQASIDIISVDYKARTEAGETKDSILRYYAELLKTDKVRPVREMQSSEIVSLAQAISQSKEG